MEIKLLKEKMKKFNENEKLIFDNKNNGLIYIGDMFMYLYNQSKMIENLINKKIKRKNSKKIPYNNNTNKDENI
jgi:hypothetical protein